MLSVSGGGWNSMSNLAGAMAGSIDRLESLGLERKIDSILKGYDYISGNSGGTWFLTSLGFLEQYQDSLENRTKADSYNTTGFNKKVKRAFDSIGYLGGINRTASVAGMLLQFGRNWGDFIEKTVYEQISDQAVLETSFLQANLADWALDKNIIFAIALTKNSNLDSSGKEVSKSEQFDGPPIIQQGLFMDKIFASYDPSGSALKKYNESNFVPFSIEINSSGESIYRTTSKQKSLSINYSNNKKRGPSPQIMIFPEKGSANSIKAISPSLASSAAVAALAFPATVGEKSKGEEADELQKQAAHALGNLAAYEFRSLAPIISFDEQGISQINQEPTPAYSFKDTLNTIARSGYIRTADGGYLDNTSVAYNLSSAFNNGSIDEKNSFELSLFQNNSSPISDLVNIKGQNNSFALFPSDLAALFGLDDDQRSASVDDVKVHPESGLWTLSSQVFNSHSLTESDLTPIWSWNEKDGGDIQLVHYTVDVETVSNDVYGIKPGVKGKFNIYLSLNPSSDAIPFKKEIHKDYVDNFNSWRAAIEEAPTSISFFDSLETIHLKPSIKNRKLSSRDERVIGTKGSDVIKAYGGDDYLFGHSGNDRLIGGYGADILDGGAGKDIFRYQSLRDSRLGVRNRDIIVDFQPGIDKIDLRPISKDLDLRFIGADQFQKAGDIRFKNGVLRLNADDDMNPEFKISISGSNIDQLIKSDLMITPEF